MTNSFATFHPFHGGYEIEKLEDSSEIESPGFFVFDYGLIEKIKKLRARLPINREDK